MEHMSAKAFLTIQGGKEPKKNKYSAQRVEFDGISFDSKKEAVRWAELVLTQRAGEIKELKRQVPIMLQGRDGPLKTRTGQDMRLTVDFQYIEVATGLLIYEDAKGMVTRDYEVRRSVAGAMGIEVAEI